MTPGETKALAARYRKLYAGVVYDAMKWDAKAAEPFVLSTTIRPLWPEDEPLVGPAFLCAMTIVGEPAVDDTKRLDLLEHIREGSVFVLVGGVTDVAMFGDISARLLKQRGAAGAVIDGYTRDSGLIARIEWPVFCIGSRPEDAYGRVAIEECDYAVTGSSACERVEISTGDWVFAEHDGVLIIPEAKAEEVCSFAEKRAQQEQQMRKALEREPPEEVYRRLGRW